jgi:hypothetical protein
VRPRDEARELLAPVYGRFSEGFDMRDLKEAKALLDELVGRERSSLRQSKSLCVQAIIGGRLTSVRWLVPGAYFPRIAHRGALAVR